MNKSLYKSHHHIHSPKTSPWPLVLNFIAPLATLAAALAVNNNVFVGLWAFALIPIALVIAIPTILYSIYFLLKEWGNANIYLKTACFIGIISGIFAFGIFAQYLTI